jgi:hypothetical protein
MLEQNLDKVNWSNLSSNPNAIHMLEQNVDKVCWHWLSNNPNAIHLLEFAINGIKAKTIRDQMFMFQLLVQPPHAQAIPHLKILITQLRVNGAPANVLDSFLNQKPLSSNFLVEFGWKRSAVEYLPNFQPANFTFQQYFNLTNSDNYHLKLELSEQQANILQQTALTTLHMNIVC